MATTYSAHVMIVHHVYAEQGSWTIESSSPKRVVQIPFKPEVLALLGKLNALNNTDADIGDDSLLSAVKKADELLTKTGAEFSVGSQVSMNSMYDPNSGWKPIKGVVLFGFTVRAKDTSGAPAMIMPYDVFKDMPPTAQLKMDVVIMLQISKITT